MTVTIGIDPHKSTRTAVAIDGDERQLARLISASAKLTLDTEATTSTSGRHIAGSTPVRPASTSIAVQSLITHP